MDQKNLEISCLLGWLRTFPLQSQATSPSDLSDGLALAEVLVQIEPATFTPTWFAGLLKSANCNNETLNSLLNMLLHYYTHNLADDCIAGELPLPDLTSRPEDSLGLENIARFLKLTLGVAVTCSNKVLFISKIQSLDETTQHALTACIVSFISTKDWTEKSSSTDQAQELKLSPAGDEIWKQKVHELDYQVALLKEERMNLMSENEELFGKVKQAQTLSRKDSLKSRHLESELSHMKDEFERLKLEYEDTRVSMAGIDQKLKAETRDSSALEKMCEEVAALKADFTRLQCSLSSRENGQKWLAGESVSNRLESHQELINELKNDMHYQASLQARLGEELSTVKDQVDVLREQFHRYSRYSVELGDIRTKINELETTREDMMGDILKHQQLHSFSVTSNESIEFISTTNVCQANTDSMDVIPTNNVTKANNDVIDKDIMPLSNIPRPSNDSLEVLDINEVSQAKNDVLNNTNVSQANNQLDETLVLPTQVPLESQLLRHAEFEADRESCGVSQETEANSTHPLTARTLDEGESLDGDVFSEEERIRKIEDWNFSSVQTVDDKSVDEDHQKELIEKMFRRRNPKADTDEVDSSGCFGTWMLPFFVKVFD